MSAPLFDRTRQAIQSVDLIRPVGHVRQVVGTVVEVEGLAASLGDLCRIRHRRQESGILAEVIGFRDDTLLLMPYTDLEGIASGYQVTTSGETLRVPVGPHLLGRVIDAFGNVIDGGPPLAGGERVGRRGRTPSPLSRQRIDSAQRTGVRAIDAFITCAKGQRLGIFAGSGVGKSVLLGMISRHSDADVNVVALIGERGREVREFIEEDLGPDGLKRSVVVVATSDESPVLRIRAAESAMAIGEWFRDRDHNVMFMMDSATRYAMAQREIGLAAGEPPTTKGYPPSTFAQLPRLLERAGTSAINAMTAFFTVLVEGDDMNEPVGDAVRSIVDGHIVLTRDLARRGHYPAIDVMGSVSRLMQKIASEEHLSSSQHILGQLKLLEENQDLITIGAYKPGNNHELDAALAAKPRIEQFLRQGLEDHVPMAQTLAELAALTAPGA